MSDEQAVRSKKSTKRKTYNLFDFLVVKNGLKKGLLSKKTFKNKVNTKLKHKNNKKLSTLKKRILKQRAKKKQEQQIEEIETFEETSELTENNADETNLIQEVTAITEAISKIQFSQNIPRVPSEIKHSKSFRNYCDHFISQEIKQFTEALLKDVVRFQQNKFDENPVKAKANRRYVVGFKEVKKYLIVKKLKLLIISTDMEQNQEVDNQVQEITNLARQTKTLLVFGIKRRHLGYILLKKVPVSCVGIFSYDGTIENVNNLMKQVELERNKYCLLK